MEIIEFNKELQKELGEGIKEIQGLCEESINIMEDCKSKYDKYILEEEYPRLLGRYIKELEENKRLLEEIKLKNNRINYLSDELDRLQDLLTDNGINYGDKEERL